MNITTTIPEEAKSIRPHPLDFLPHDVHARHISREAPMLQDLCEIRICDYTLRFFCVCEDLLCLSLGNEAVSAHDCGLIATTLDEKVLVIEPIFLGKLFAIPLHHG